MRVVLLLLVGLTAVAAHGFTLKGRLMCNGSPLQWTSVALFTTDLTDDLLDLGRTDQFGSFSVTSKHNDTLKNVFFNIKHKCEGIPLMEHCAINFHRTIVPVKVPIPSSDSRFRSDVDDSDVESGSLTDPEFRLDMVEFKEETSRHCLF